MDYKGLDEDLNSLPGVKMVHSLHCWALTMDKHALNVHLAVGE